jgi:N,N'-diacetyllegionaminate synthase
MRSKIIAEIGNNHEGSLAVALELVEQAANAGADYAKFQWIKPAELVDRSQEDRIRQLNQFCLNFQDFEKISQHCKDVGIKFLASSFSLSASRELRTLSHSIKISSSDNNYQDLIEYNLEHFDEVFISLGNIEPAKIQDKVCELINLWRKSKDKIHFLHCVSQYPTKLDHASMDIFKNLKKYFPDYNIGYSDHTEGLSAAFYAISHGASVVEKHFTLDKNYSDFRDHQLSADISELRQLTDFRDNLTTMTQELSQAVAVNTQLHRFAHAQMDLKKGQLITVSDIAWLRNSSADGICDRKLIIGAKLATDITAGSAIQLDNLL